MRRRQHNQKFSALACGTFQHVVQVACQETRPEAGNQQFSVHWFVEIPQIDDTFVFPARGDKPQPFMGFNKGKLRLDATSQVEGWTFHDLRRTGATGMAQLGVPPHIVERVLNHASGTFGGVAGIYNRFAYLPEMREALDTWDEKVTCLLQD